MKKLFLSILVICSLLSGNAYAKDVNLHCMHVTSYNFYDTKVVTITRDDIINSGIGSSIDRTFIINARTKKILRQKYDGEFVPINENQENFDIVWSDYNIVWTFEYSKDDTLHKRNLNRSSGELVEEVFFGDKSLFKKETGLHSQKAKYKCQLSEKLF